MNIKQILIAAAIVAGISATTVMAQGTPAAAPAAAAQGESGKAKKPEGKFEDRKAKKLEGLSKRAAKIQELQACAQASTDNQSLDKCFPKRGKGKGRHHKHGGDDAASAPAEDAAPVSK